MARLTNTEIEKRWYDIFESWPKSDREAAIKVLERIHPRLPDDPKADPEQAALPGVKP